MLMALKKPFAPFKAPLKIALNYSYNKAHFAYYKSPKSIKRKPAFIFYNIPFLNTAKIQALK